jgi:hypothetical protein
MRKKDVVSLFCGELIYKPCNLFKEKTKENFNI